MNTYINELINLGFKEDLSSSGDITSLAIFNDEKDSFYLICKSDGVLCGIDIFKKSF